MPSLTTLKDRTAGTADFLPAAEAALAAFPIEPAGIEPVSLSENATFRVVDRRDGSVYVLRLHRPWYHSHEELLSERVWMRALSAAGISVPRGVRSHDGRDYVQVDVAHNSERRWAGVTHWIEGELLLKVMRESADLAVIAAHFQRLGAMTARLHNQSSVWLVPPGFRRQSLDVEGLMGEQPFWGRFWEHRRLSADESALLLRARDRMRDVLQRLGQDRAIYGLIHADLHPANLLVQGDRLTVIDFDDCGFGWHLYDIAVAFVHHQDAADFPVLQQSFIDGYRTERPLPDSMVALLPAFRLIRGMAQIGWFHQRPELDDGPFLRHSKDNIIARCEALLSS